MTGYTQLPTKKNGLNGALAVLFKNMLSAGAVDAILVPCRREEGGVMQALVSDSARLDNIDPFAPVVPINSAKLISSMTMDPSGRPVAVVVRSCEMRALIELVKLKQANLDNVILIGLDCLGRYENTDFRSFQGGAPDKATATFLQDALKGKTKQPKSAIDLSLACNICEFPVADNVDMRLCVIGGDGGEVWVQWVTETGEAMCSKLGLEADANGPKNRDKAVEQLVQKRTETRDKVFAEFRGKVDNFEALADHLAGCINCYNCRVACPVCYCNSCVFVTDTFRHSGDQYFNWADKRGSIKMPTDTLFYHITRMTHIGATCVGCGQCTSACPNDITLAELFRTTAEKTQARFEYQAGRSLDEPQPLAVFKEDELGDVTGQVK
ncbi:MAG: formate dehydrogenase [Proteobacteria bacterium]|nr:formate dehydrogenase [Pseudomonadota bacterium]